MRNLSNIAEDLFRKIRGRVSSISLGNTNGEVTTDISEARFFEFTYKDNGEDIGNITININEDGVLTLFFPNSMVDNLSEDRQDAWYSFLKDMQKFSQVNMLNFETKNLTKSRLDKKDYQFLTQKNKQDDVMENKLYGSKQKSFYETGGAKIIIKHKKPVDENKLGSRSRNISSIYIENSQGERFKFPNTYLPGARAMARHIANEGHTRDEKGVHIIEIMQEMANLKTFVRTTKRTDYVNEEAKEIINNATDRYYSLKDTLKSISSDKGYQTYFENFAPDEIDVDENDINDLKEKLTRQVFDDRMNDVLPSVGKAIKLARNKTMEKDEMGTDAELDAKMKDAMDSLVSFADSKDNLVAFDNANKEEIKSYVEVIKNSDMDTKQKMRNLSIGIAEYLGNNLVDDEMAQAVSRLNPANNNDDYQTAMKLAMKMMKGGIEYQAPKMKKDLYGKDKMESFEQNMDMIIEGTWSLPENDQEAEKMIELMKKPIRLGKEGEDATAAISFALGDDELYDDLGFAGDNNPEADARPIIKKWIEGAKDRYGDPYTEFLEKIHDEVTRAEPTTGTGAKGLEKSLDKLYGPKKEEVALGDDVEADEDIEESRYKDYLMGMEQDAAEMSKEEFLQKYGKSNEDEYDRVRAEMKAQGMESTTNESETKVEEPVTEPQEGDNELAKIKDMAGIGSNLKANFPTTPRSLVARELNKLRELETQS